MTASAVILFHSNNHVMWSARVLKKAGLQCKLMSIPRHLSSDCGYCIMIEQEFSEKARKLLEDAGIEYNRISDLD